jgi:hypothetical protein
MHTLARKPADPARTAVQPSEPVPVPPVQMWSSYQQPVPWPIQMQDGPQSHSQPPWITNRTVSYTPYALPCISV